MANTFFDHPILNAPYECPQRHWELDSQRQPTQQVFDRRRRAEFITPIPKPKKRKQPRQQAEMVFDEGKGLSTKEQQYDPTSIINEVRQHVDRWRALPNPTSGRSARKPRACSDTGGIIHSAACARSSVRWKLSLANC